MGKNGQAVNPSLYEINTRLLVRRFSLSGKRNALLQVPENYWKSLVDKGIQYVWLMGVWQTRESGYAGCVYHPDDLKRYRQVLPDLKEEDLMGSPYAIDQYVLDPYLGDPEDLGKLKKRLNKKGLKLILDFVPNHFGKHSRYTRDYPDHFIQGTAENLRSNPRGFHEINGIVFAKAKDPYFPAWQDTIQVNYNRPETRQWMIECLQNIAAHCDGVRCDMAMLVTQSVFHETWSWHQSPVPWAAEFWQESIAAVKRTYPEFITLAEVYWDMQTQLLDMGFDYCYEKSLLDNLKTGNLAGLRQLSEKPLSYLQQTAHFLENHDEERARSIFALEQHISAAVFCYSLPGMRFFHDGQWEGARTRIPVQLGRAPADQPCTCPLALELGESTESRPSCACIALFYQRLLVILKERCIQVGKWSLCNAEAFGKDKLPETIFSWEWQLGNERILVVINLGQQAESLSLTAYCKDRQLPSEAHELLSDMRIPLNAWTLYPRQACVFKFEYIRSSGTGV